MTSGCVGSIKLTIFIAAPHVGHRNGSTCQTRLIRAAQRRRAALAEGDRGAGDWASCAQSPPASARSRFTWDGDATG